MIAARHIGQLFSVMRASYGHLWPHNSAEDAQIWLRRLGGYTPSDVMGAAERMPKMYPDHPPTLGQFDAAVGPREWIRSTMIEDKREPGRMSFADWKKANGL